MASKKKREIQTEEFERFDEMLRKVVSVPKDELMRREKDAKESKEGKRNEQT